MTRPWNGLRDVAIAVPRLGGRSRIYVVDVDRREARLVESDFPSDVDGGSVFHRGLGYVDGDDLVVTAGVKRDNGCDWHELPAPFSRFRIVA